MTNWMLSYLAAVGTCYTLSMGGILYYFGKGAEEREQDREHLQACQQALLANERYDGQTIEMFCNNLCLRNSFIHLREERNGEGIETIVGGAYRMCGE